MPPMHIVVLDGHTLNPGDLDWSPLAELGALQVHARTAPEQVLARAAGAEVVLTNKTRLSAQELDQLRDLRYVGVLATGYDVVDVAAADERGIVVTNVPAYGTASVAQMTFALLLELCNHVGAHAAAAREGRWTQSGDFSHRERPLMELSGRTLGIVGFGRIGQAVAGIARAFGMHVIATPSHRGQGAALDDVRRVEVDELVARADVVTLHCPLTEDTAQLIDARRLASMKRHALLVNTARGGLIDEHALRAALDRGHLGGVALDVLSVEPPPADHPLLSAPRCLVTPHIAWATRASRERLLGEAIANVRAFSAGERRNVVSRVEPGARR